MTWERYIAERLPPAARPHAWTVVLGYEFLRVLERDRLLAVLRRRVVGEISPSGFYVRQA